MRLIFQIGQLKRRRRHARLTDSLRTRNPFVGDDGRPNLGRLLAAAPFPVYGLKGRPIGLRLKSRGGGGDGAPVVINQIDLGYVVGHPSNPEKAVDLTQGPDVDGGMGELTAIKSLVYYKFSEERGESRFHQRSFYRGWNEERLQNTPRHQATIQIGGMNLVVHYASWDEPQRVILARLTIENHPLRVTFLNTSWEELREVIATLVLLKGDQETLVDYQTWMK